MRDLPKEQIVADLQKAVGAVREQAGKGVPNDPRLRQLRTPIFAFSRRQLDLENEVLEEKRPAPGEIDAKTRLPL